MDLDFHYSVFEVFFLDVGQGNCTIVKAYLKAKHYDCWIFDCGSGQYPEFIAQKITKGQPGYQIMSDYIVDLIIDCNSIHVMLSHPDSDHKNMIFWVLAKLYHKSKFPKCQVFYTSPWVKSDFLPKRYSNVMLQLMVEKMEEEKQGEQKNPELENKEEDPLPDDIEYIIEWKHVSRGLRLNWKGKESPFGRIFVLSTKDQGRSNRNDNSVCILFTCPSGDKERKILLTGDISATVLEDYLKTQEARIHVCSKTFVLQVPHHGAEDSLTPTILKILDPELIFISSHRESQYHHPSYKIIDMSLEFLSQRRPIQISDWTPKYQIQPWHLIPFDRPQYLQELPFHVKNWNYNFPLLMGRRESNHTQRVIYATNLGLYSTTWERSYCVTFAKFVRLM
jgi:hypothetical protein